LSKALHEVVAAGVLQAYESLATRVTKLNEGLEVIFNGEKPNFEYSGNWKRKVLDISEEVLQTGAIFLEEVTDKERDMLKPLRGIQGQVVELSQFVEGYELKPTKANLRCISREELFYSLLAPPGNN
jgi:hypothetical protein